MDIDDRRPVFGRGPAPQLVRDDLADLEPGKDLVINAGPEREVELGLNSELLDFRWTEGRHAASVPKSSAVLVSRRSRQKVLQQSGAISGNNGSREVTRGHVSFQGSQGYYLERRFDFLS